jgi:hypothetical protein
VRAKYRGVALLVMLSIGKVFMPLPNQQVPTVIVPNVIVGRRAAGPLLKKPRRSW